MKWDLGNGIRKVPRLVEIAKAWKNREWDSAKIVHWAALRFGRESRVLEAERHQMDSMAADMALIDDKSAEWDMVTKSHPDAIRIAVEVMVASGDLDWAQWASGEALINQMLAEVMSPLKDTDEDKRAQVLLKRADVHKKISEMSKLQDAIMLKLAGTEDKATHFRGGKVGPESWATHATKRDDEQ